jgi:hypothetical protein
MTKAIQCHKSRLVGETVMCSSYTQAPASWPVWRRSRSSVRIPVLRPRLRRDRDQRGRELGNKAA